MMLTHIEATYSATLSSHQPHITPAKVRLINSTYFFFPQAPGTHHFSSVPVFVAHPTEPDEHLFPHFRDSL